MDEKNDGKPNEKKVNEIVVLFNRLGSSIVLLDIHVIGINDEVALLSHNH